MGNIPQDSSVDWVVRYDLSQKYSYKYFVIFVIKILDIYLSPSQFLKNMFLQMAWVGMGCTSFSPFLPVFSNKE